MSLLPRINTHTHVCNVIEIQQQKQARCKCYSSFISDCPSQLGVAWPFIYYSIESVSGHTIRMYRMCRAYQFAIRRRLCDDCWNFILFSFEFPLCLVWEIDMMTDKCIYEAHDVLRVECGSQCGLSFAGHARL